MCKIILITFLSSLLYSCDSTQNKDVKKSFSKTDSCNKGFEELLNYRKKGVISVIQNDKKQYDDVINYFTNLPYTYDHSFIALNMAYIRNIPKAYHDVYYSFNHINNFSSDTAKALYYFRMYNLALSYEKDYDNAKIDVYQLKDKNGKILSSDYFLRKFGEKNKATSPQ